MRAYENASREAMPEYRSLVYGGTRGRMVFGHAARVKPALLS
jgi:hypothetical protein